VRVLMFVPPGLVALLTLVSVLPFLLLAAATLVLSWRSVPQVRRLPAPWIVALVLAAAGGAAGGQLVGALTGIRGGSPFSGGDVLHWAVPATSLALVTTALAWSGSRARRSSFRSGFPLVGAMLLVAAAGGFVAPTLPPVEALRPALVCQHNPASTGCPEDPRPVSTRGTASLVILGGLDSARGDATATCAREGWYLSGTLVATFRLANLTLPVQMVIGEDGRPHVFAIHGTTQLGERVDAWGEAVNGNGSGWQAGDVAFDLRLRINESEDPGRRLSGTFTWSCDPA
jgi:hypothetical protein